MLIEFVLYFLYLFSVLNVFAMVVGNKWRVVFLGWMIKGRVILLKVYRFFCNFGLNLIKFLDVMGMDLESMVRGRKK